MGARGPRPSSSGVKPSKCSRTARSRFWSAADRPLPRSDRVGEGSRKIAVALPSANHFVYLGHQRWRAHQIQHLGGSEANHELEGTRLPGRQPVSKNSSLLIQSAPVFKGARNRALSETAGEVF